MINSENYKEVLLNIDLYKPKLLFWEIFVRFFLGSLIVADLTTDILFLIFLNNNNQKTYFDCTLAIILLPAFMSILNTICTSFSDDHSATSETINISKILKPLYYLSRFVGFEAIFIYYYSAFNR